MTTLHIHAQNPTFYLAIIALGLLDAIKSGAIPLEAGIWTLRKPSIYDAIQPYCPAELHDIIDNFDELDAIFQLSPDKLHPILDNLIARLQTLLIEYREEYDLDLTIN